jgi:23S rRNA (cytidine2498-2'-O)-methyltransferase
MVRQIVEQVGPSAESQSDSDAPAATDQSTPPTWQELHVVERDSALPGASHFEPGRSALAAEIAAEFKKQLLAQGDWRSDHVLANIRRGTEAELKGTEAQLGSDEQKASSAGQPVSERASSQPRRILEVIIMQPNRWWITSRVATTPFDLCVGGVPAIPTQDGIVSRAYLKVADALQWSGITITEKSRCVEIGSSPGGSCQRLLELGASVTGIDPADMDELVLAHPRFRHWKSRSQHIKRKRFTEFDYLFCDANVAPEYTLKNVEEIVCYPECNFQAVALTIKLSNYGQSSEIPEHIERVKSWGFKHVAARQLAHSRREYCLVGQR